MSRTKKVTHVFYDYTVNKMHMAQGLLKIVSRPQNAQGIEAYPRHIERSAKEAKERLLSNHPHLEDDMALTGTLGVHKDDIIWVTEVEEPERD